MTLIAPLLETFFTDRLCKQRQASPNTISAYRDAFRLLLGFAQQQHNKMPSDLLLTELDASFIGSFLQHLENDRGNSARTRNLRLSAIHSFFRYLALEKPEHGGLIQRVLAIPPKRCDRNIINYLTRPEIEAILAAPDRLTWIGRRDHALLLVAVQTGLRVSELVSLRVDQLVLQKSSPHVRCRGKGRKERVTPLTKQAVTELSALLRECGNKPDDPVFLNRRGGSLSRDAVERRVTKYTRIAAETCSTLKKKKVSPHTFRHTAAVELLQAGVDRSVIALWLGHESVETTQIYLHADLSIKEIALQRWNPLPGIKLGRYRPEDSLMAFLQRL